MKADLAIVGAGSAGSAAALLAARRGLSVIVVEQRPLAKAGARWVNEVPRWAWSESGIDAPVGREALATGGRYHLLAGRGLARVTAEAAGTTPVDMRRLIARLQEKAREAGARFVDRVRVLRVEPHALLTTAGAIRADHIVDASGVAGGDGPLCVAAQAVHRIGDRARAEAWLAAHGAEPGDTVAFGALHGGFSVLSARVVGDRVALLAGAIPADGHPPGRAMLRRFVAEQTWIGPARFGGASAIPLGPARPVDGAIARVGDAASQVFPAHASGVAVGLVAARLLADAVADGAGVRSYARAYESRFGRLFATYRRLAGVVRRLSAEHVAWLMRLGVIDAEGVEASLEQRLPRGGILRRLVPSPAFVLSRGSA